MLIGQLAEAVGQPPQTIRFYERKGLLPDPERGANGYRNYAESAVTRLHFIGAAQAAGLTLAEIGSILELRDDGNVPCTHVVGLVENKLAAVRARIATLGVLEAELETLLERSHHLDPADCTDAEICHILSTPR
jgi:DNA-binding transcriptional MerR regulator